MTMLRRLLPAFLLLAISVVAQVTPNPTGKYPAALYNFQPVVVNSDVVAGAATVNLGSCTVSANNKRVYPWAVGNSLFISGDASETITVSAIPTEFEGNCSITATFASNHSSGRFFVSSGTYGLQEAINDAHFNGGGIVLLDPTFQGTTATIGAVAGVANVLVEDVRAGNYVIYYWNGANYVAAGGAIVPYTVAGLPASPPDGTLAIATDGFGSTGSCTQGGGTTRTLCQFSATLSGWLVINPSISPSTFTDFPSKIFIPAGVCNNATAATTWSLPTSSAATPNCATGSNTQVGVLSFADGNSAQATYYMPEDWDGSSSVDSSIFFTSSSTSGTVIFNIALSCTNVNGTQTDNQAFNSSMAYTTVTLTTPTNAAWSSQANGLNVTNCTAGELLHIKISRATDTASDTGVAVRGISLTVRRTF